MKWKQIYLMVQNANFHVYSSIHFMINIVDGLSNDDDEYFRSYDWVISFDFTLIQLSSIRYFLPVWNIK